MCFSKQIRVSVTRGLEGISPPNPGHLASWPSLLRGGLSDYQAQLYCLTGVSRTLEDEAPTTLQGAIEWATQLGDVLQCVARGSDQPWTLLTEETYVNMRGASDRYYLRFYIKERADHTFPGITAGAAMRPARAAVGDGCGVGESRESAVEIGFVIVNHLVKYRDAGPPVKGLRIVYVSLRKSP